MTARPELVLGWREWITLPELGIPLVKAKIDTGAKTSALHAFELEEWEDGDIAMVTFKIHPIQKREDIVVTCSAPIADRRMVSDSGGHRENRVVIRTPITFGNTTVDSDITLTSRENMLFRMLLGRRTLEEAGAMVDVNGSYLLGRYRTRDWPKEYERTI